MLGIKFDELDIYMAEYGSSHISDRAVRVRIEGGLGVPEKFEHLFPRRYLYDPWEKVKYSAWRWDKRGLLQALIEGSQDEWTVYDDRTIGREILKYQYVGGCWFVFDEVDHWTWGVQKEGDDYVSASSLSDGDVVETEGGRKYNMEGALMIPPGPGWISWAICAHRFYVEI